MEPTHQKVALFFEVCMTSHREAAATTMHQRIGFASLTAVPDKQTSRQVVSGLYERCKK